MKLLLTGASSFVGRNLIELFDSMALSWSVSATYHSRKPSFDHDVDLVQVDLSQVDEVSKLDANFDAILHIAARSPEPGISNADYVKSNIVATQNIVNFANDIGCSKIIYASSVSIHGEVQTPVLDHETPIINPDPYGLSKRAGEQLLEEWVSDGKGRLGVSLRFPSVVGPQAHKHWLASVVEAVKADKEINIFNPKGAFNNILHVRDLARLIASILGREQQGTYAAFSIASAGSMTIEDVVKTVFTQLGKDEKIKVVDRDQTTFTISNERATELFHYAPMDIEEALKLYLSEVKD